jgi:hypothetical protein
MNKEAVVDPHALIQFIVSNNPKIKKRQLEDLSVESLVLIKVQIEIEQMKKKKTPDGGN